MKIMIISLAVIASLYSTSAQPPNLNEFWGLKLGSPVKDCEKILQSHGGKMFVKASKNEIWYRGGITIDNDTALVVAMKFNKNKLYNLTVDFGAGDTNNIKIYNRIRKYISTKYSKPGKEVYSIETPFKIGDGKENEAVLSNKANIWCSWSNGNNGTFTQIVNLEMKRRVIDAGEASVLVEFTCSDELLAP